MTHEPGGRANGAALADDDRLAVGGEVPHVREGQRHQLAGVEIVVCLLWLAGHAVEKVVDDEPVYARIGPSAQRGVPDAGERGDRRHTRIREPRALAAQPGERRHHLRMRLEVIDAHPVEHEQRDDAWPLARRLQGFLKDAARRGRRRCDAEDGGERRRDVLLGHWRAPRALADDARPVKEQRHVRVVPPR